MTKQDNSSYDGYRPQQSYIPGGGSSSGSTGDASPEQPPAPEGGAAGQRRPLGSLGRRLQQQPPASAPSNTSRDQDDRYPPQRGSRSRPPREDREPRRGYGAPDDRGRGSSRPSTDGRRRGRGYGDDDDYGAGDRAPYGYDDDAPNEAPGWGEEPGRRTPSRFDRGGPPEGESEEMIARRGGSRSVPPRRRGGPDAGASSWDDQADPLDDPRAPPGMHGSSRGGPPARRSGVSGPSGAARGRGPSRHDDDPRRGSGRYEPPGYTDEGPAARFDGNGMEGFSEEYEARPRYGDDWGGPAGGRGSRSTPGGGRAPDEFGRPSGYGRPPARSEYSPGDAGGYDARYAQAPGYSDFSAAYPPARGSQMGRGGRDSFAESSEWAPGGVMGGGRGANVAQPPAKRKSGILGIATRLLTVVVVVVGLVTVVGPELAPKLGKYLPFLGGSAQSTPPPAFATYTPGPTPTNLPNYKLFSSATKGYAMDYPSSWGTATVNGSGDSQGDSVDKFTQGSGPAVVSVERAPAFDSATDAQLIQAEVTGAQAQGVTLTEITSAATNVGIGGEIWQRREFSATTKNNTKLHIAVLSCHHLGKGYVVALISSDTGFAKDDTATFEPMLRSFRFL